MSAISRGNRKFLGRRAPANAGPPKSGNPAKNALFSLTPSSLSKRSGITKGLVGNAKFSPRQARFSSGPNLSPLRATHFSPGLNFSPGIAD